LFLGRELDRFLSSSNQKGAVRLEALFDPDVSLHHQIYQQMRTEILDGVWVGRDDFPGEEELAARYGVSVITSRKSLVRLVEDGLVERGRGRRPRATYEPRATISSSRPTVFPIGPHRPYKYKIIETEIRVAQAEACEAFGLKYGVQLWHCSRMRHFEGRPHSFVVNVQQPEVGKKHKVSKLTTLPMSVILKQEGFTLGSIKRQVAAKFPGTLASQNLGIPMHAAILHYTFVLTNDTDAPLEWVQIALHPNESPPLEVFDLRTGTVRVTDVL